MASPKPKVKWVSGPRFMAASGSGHDATMDGSRSGDLHGSLGLTLMETLLLGLGGYSAIDVVTIFKRMRQLI